MENPYQTTYTTQGRTLGQTLGMIIGSTSTLMSLPLTAVAIDQLVGRDLTNATYTVGYSILLGVGGAALGYYASKNE